MDLADRVREAVADRYAVEGELGRGGMAVVYLARDLRHERRVAIKVLRPELSASLLTDRFLQEIQIAAQLQHPLIVPLHDSGASGDLLWYVMPFIEGETLRQRLRREQQLPLKEALDIARDAAEALECAHQHGVVHRDIKPENILLSGGHALLADFGIARALTRAAGGVTSSGVAIGTPAYMSPEQGAGGATIDVRSDVYSLGCVVYEMLAGEPPFTGPTPQAVIARHVSERPPSVRVVRPAVKPGLEQTIRKALAKTPADRFATAAEFARALETAAAEPEAEPGPVPWVAAAAILVIAAVAGVWAVRTRLVDNTAADTTRYVILPFEHETGVAVGLNEVQRLHDAFGRWSGLTVADPFRVREALDRLDEPSLTHRAASELARELGAGRYVRGSLSRIGDSLRIQAGLFDADANGTVLGDYAVRIAAGDVGLDAQFAALADRLLLRHLVPDSLPALMGTASLPARQLLAVGDRALEVWNLTRADSAFSAAVALDPAYTQAHLWAALARAWGGAETARFRLAAEQAALGRAGLSGRDQGLADAVVAHARGELGDACPKWWRLTVESPRDWAAWYGYAFCLRGDTRVVRDSRSPSGWRFRSSYQEAVRAYRRAFELRPSILSGFRSSAYRPLRQVLMTTWRIMRPGQALPPDTGAFRARLMRTGDSVALVPYPFAQTQGPVSIWDPRAVEAAIARQQALFYEIAVGWATAFPQNAAALEAVAVALEMLGNPASVDTLRRAQAVAATAGERASAAATEGWLEVKLGVPGDLPRVRRAKLLADSLLRDAAALAAAPEPLASLAALTGRANLAASLYRRASPTGTLQQPIAGPAAALLMFASLGGPPDSVRFLERQIADELADSSLAMRLEWLGRPARLAAPPLDFPSTDQLLGKGDYLLDTQAALVEGDSQLVRRTLAELQRSRRSVPAAELAIDALYPEAILLTRLGDTGGAIAWLDPTLGDLRHVPPETFQDPARPGALLHAMVLRADLADQASDRAGAARWAGVVTVLWADADPFLQPVVKRMARMLSR